MKKIYSALLSLLVVLSTLVVSCTKDADSSASGSIMITQDAISATSATFTLSTKSASLYAYKVHKGTLSSTSNALIIFADAEESFELEDGDNSSSVYGLEGNEDYTVEFAFRMKDGSYQVKKASFTTTDYNENRIQIISAERNSVKFMINVEEGVKYRYKLIDRNLYEMSRLMYGDNDLSFLESGTKGDGPTTVSLNDGDIIGVDTDGASIIQFIKPAMSFVVLLVECDDNYNPLCQRNDAENAPAATTRVAEPNLEEYSEQCTDANLEFTGFYARQKFTTREPLPAAGDVEVSITTTELTATLSLVPSPEVLRIGYGVFTEYDLKDIEGYVGADGLITAIQPETASTTEAVEFQQPITPGVNYVLVVLYISDEAEQTRTTKMIPFKAMESTQEPVEIIVTACDASKTSAGYINPNKVAFNIKAPDKNCNRIMVAVDYTKLFIPYLNGMTGDSQEAKLKTLVLSNGIEWTAALNKSAFDAINSDKGCVFEFDSFEDTESMIAVLSFNADEKTFLATATSMSAVEPAKDPVSNEFFDNIDGNWTATYTFLNGLTANEEENYIHDEFDMYITDDPTFGAPAEFNKDTDPRYEKLYNYYIGRGMQLGKEDPYTYATEQIQADFEDFLEVGAHFQEKYKAQNRKIIFGFALDKAGNTTVANHSPWDLFCDLGYSSYDVEQIFYEYGPKIFLEAVEENGEVVIKLINDYTIVPPFFVYYGSTYSLVGMSATAYLKYPEIFTEPTGVVAGGLGMPFEVVDDNNFNINAYVDGDGLADYYPAVGYDLYGMMDFEAIGKSNITVKRNNSTMSAPVRNINVELDKKVPMREGNHFKRMRLHLNE